jgi:hypothetical protein
MLSIIHEMLFRNSYRMSDRHTKHAGYRNAPLMLFSGVVTVALSSGLFFLLPHWTQSTYVANEYTPTGMGVEQGTTTQLAQMVATTSDTARPAHSSTTPAYVSTPDSVRAIYMSQCVVGTPSFRDDLVSLVEETELNALIIDLKDYTGKLAFETDHPELVGSVSDECGARDMRAFVSALHEKGIYVIGRITVFQDPHYSSTHPELAVKFANPVGAVWKDGKGLSFIDVGAKPFWDYIVTISREAHALGFDELNYDYVRFPSDGPMQNIHYDWAGERPKEEVVEEFFAYLSDAMKDVKKYPLGVDPPVLSADLFGMVTTNYDDLNIGQVLERALPYFDYIAPMVYPSHYPAGFNGWSNPNTVPYELIKFVMDSAVERTVADSSKIPVRGSEPIYETVVVPPSGSTTATTTKKVATGMYTKEVYDKDKIRPWLQDFDYGGTYDVAEVKAQIQATYDAGLDSWMLWAPSNRYTREALLGADEFENAVSQ